MRQMARRGFDPFAETTANKITEQHSLREMTKLFPPHPPVTVKTVREHMRSKMREIYLILAEIEADYAFNRCDEKRLETRKRARAVLAKFRRTVRCDTHVSS